MASLEEIGAMKLHAIVNSGTRLKDYVDMHFLLERHCPDRFTSAYAAKYPDSNAAVAKNALLYHKDIRVKGRIELIGREFN